MRFESLDAWLKWQEGLHPAEIELGLDRIQSVYQNFTSPNLDSVIITVAGTNGKGSCVHLLEQIYLAAGYKVGSYTSPHLYHYNERIKINGDAVSDEMLCDAFEKVDQARTSDSTDPISLTYFEFGTLAALSVFRQQPLDVVILEVGMGGRLDAVNILDADIALISSIDLDHQQWLGETREQIAFEKAGIMRESIPVVYADNDCPQAVLTQAKNLKSQLFRYNIEFTFEDQKTMAVWHWQSDAGQVRNIPWLTIQGEQIYKNASAVLQVVALAQTKLPVSHQAIRLGMHAFRLPGRLEIVPAEANSATQVFDVAHNAQSIANLASWLAQNPAQGRTHAVFGMMSDRLLMLDLSQIAAQIDEWHISQAENARAASAELVKPMILQVTNAPVVAYSSLCEAYNSALLLAQPNDRVVIFGSFYTVAETRPESL